MVEASRGVRIYSHGSFPTEPMEEKRKKKTIPFIQMSARSKGHIHGWMHEVKDT